VHAWGFELCAEHPSLWSDTVSAIRVPEGVDARDVIRIGYARYNASFGSGLARLAGRVFRIGHLGDMNPPMVLGCLAGVEAALRVQGVPCGSGALDAAIQCLARA
jgi:alanine-glyoxylate transaminase/serine-glyoxylate transaminase/serine-pyruvate transaminase